MELPSVLKGDDRVHSVHVERAVPEHSGEIVCVRRVVEFYLMAESGVLGKRVHVSFVVNHLNGVRSERGQKLITFLSWKIKQGHISTLGTYMSVRDVEKVFGAAALVELQLVTNGLLDYDIVGLLRRQNFIDILCGSHSVHLVGLRNNTNVSVNCFKLCLTLIRRHSEAEV